MTRSRELPAVALLPNGSVLVAGGSFAGGSADVYDPSTARFTATATPIAGIGSNAASLPDGRVLVAGGRAGSVMTAAAETYSLPQGEFTPVGSMTAARWFPIMTTLLDGRVLVVGGAGRQAELFTP
jgi:hypothetical protein